MDGPPAEGRNHAPADPWTACMRAEDFAGAWRIGDEVLAGRTRSERDDATRPYHQRWVWDGTPPDGVDVLVRCYHGLGDTLQFARFLAPLRHRAAHVTLEVQPALCPLLSGLPGIDRIVAFDQAAPLPPSTCTAEIMELAHMLRADARAIAACVPYLTASPLADTPPGAIALCWQAGTWDPRRSVSLPALLSACATPGRRLVSLQRGPAAAEATHASFVNPGDRSLDVARTASLIAGASRVVTVDTMAAHLAGALGRPMVLLLRADADWRWPCRPRSAWYPTATMLRQERDGDWGAPLGRLGEEGLLS